MPPTPTMLTSRESPDENDVESYLQRLAIAPGSVDTPNLKTLARLQRAHVITVPFETLAITGDPYGERAGEGVLLSVPHLYEKIVERKRGGYCFELNGLFHEVLSALGYEVYRAAARVVSAIQVPANHHVNLVELDRRYVVDVGIGPPMCRRPLPLDGTSQTDEVDVEWRVAVSERPDASYRVESRLPDEADWTPRYVFDDTPRPLRYFEATNDYLQSAPESPFTGDPTVARSTEKGYRKLSGETLIEESPSGRRERTVTGTVWHDLLAQKFGLYYGTSRSG